MILRKNCIILHGTKCHRTGLWRVPIEYTKAIIKKHIQELTTQQINNVHHTSTREVLMTFLHQCLFSPTKTTLISAIDNNQLVTFPGLTKHNVNKYLPDSPETCKGHMH